MPAWEVDKPTKFGWTPLQFASQKGHAEVARTLLASGKADPDRVTKNGLTSLIVAAARGYANVVQALLESGKVDADKAACSDGATPLYIARCACSRPIGPVGPTHVNLCMRACVHMRHAVRRAMLRLWTCCSSLPRTVTRLPTTA